MVALGVANPESLDGRLIIAGVILGGMLPDIDSPNSKINNLIWRFSPIKPRHVFPPTYNHRKHITHWPLFWMLLSSLVCSVLLSTRSPAYFIAFGTSIGVAAHLICDMFNPKGIMLLAPFSNKSFKLAKLTTNSIGEWIFLLVVSMPLFVIAARHII